MTEKERNELIDFCVKALAELNDVDESVINRTAFSRMTDKGLKEEAQWLDDLLNK